LFSLAIIIGLLVSKCISYWQTLLFDTIGEEMGVLVECRHRTDEDREALRAATHATVRKICGVDAKVSLCARGALPRTSSGKLSRSKAREMFLAGNIEI
jgi:fatty-acyl-CoA synthase